MSEGTWDVTLPLRASATPVSTPAIDRGTLPVTFGYNSRFRSVGLAFALGSVGLVLTGLFLLSQVAATPNVAVQLSAVGLMLTGAGLACLHQSTRRLLGGLTIDDQGISLTPALAGFTIPWPCLKRWQIRDRSFPLTGQPMARFWAEGQSLEFSIPAGSLSEEDLQTLRQILRDYAPELEASETWSPSTLVGRGAGGKFGPTF